jgi:uncharacterized protein
MRQFLNLSTWVSFALLCCNAGASLDTAIAAYKQGDYATAWPLFKALAVKGDATAQWNVGTMLLNGQGVPANTIEAASWIRKSAEQKHASAQNGLGFIYEKGLGVAQDSKQASGWFRLAAEQGDPFGQSNLARSYATGVGVQQDFKEALKWYQLAAKQNHGPALNDIGSIYRKGKGVKQDDVQAVSWYRKAIAQGNIAAQYNLAFHFAEGAGVSRNATVAYALFSLAGSKRPAALNDRAALAMKMNSKELAAGTALAVQMDGADELLTVIDAFVKKDSGR